MIIGRSHVFFGGLCKHYIRREALDYYLLINEKQIMKILREYIEYYNTKRPHQGIEQNIPMGYIPLINGEIKKIPVLEGLCIHYIRRRYDK